MTRNNKDLTSHKKGRYTDLCLTTKEETGKENFVLPTISIKQMRILDKKDFQKKNLKNMSITKSRVQEILKESLQVKEKMNTSVEASTKMRIEDDSFSDQNDYMNKNLTKPLKRKVLPPIDLRSTSNHNSPPRAFKSQWTEKSKSKKRLRLNTHCKVIIERNNMFPFYSNKKATKSAKERQETNNDQLTDLFDIGASKISQISFCHEPEQFFSKESATQIPIL